MPEGHFSGTITTLVNALAHQRHVWYLRLELAAVPLSQRHKMSYSKPGLLFEGLLAKLAQVRSLKKLRAARLDWIPALPRVSQNTWDSLVTLGFVGDHYSVRVSCSRGSHKGRGRRGALNPPENGARQASF